MKDLKSQILNQAQDLFAQFGFKKTTLSDIAASVGKRKTAIYYYFDNKEEIFASIIRLEAEKLYQAIEDDVNAAESLEAKMETYIASRIAIMTKTANKYKIFKGELLQFLPSIERIREPFHQKEMDLVQNILEEMQQEKKYEIKSTKIAAITLVNTLKGLEIPMFVKDYFDMSEESVQELKQILLFGIIQKRQ